MPISQNTESLYDVLYVDRERLLNYLSQIDPNGLLTSLKITGQNQGVSETSGKLNAAIASASTSIKNSVYEGHERVFDPATVLPFTVMNSLDEKGFISRDLTSAALGSLVICAGKIRIKNLQQANYLWPYLEKLIPWDQIVPNIESSAPRNNNKNHNRNMFKSIFEDLLKAMKHPIQFEMNMKNDRLWSTIKESALYDALSDVVMKYPRTVPGDWFALCLLDSRPEHVEKQSDDGWEINDDNMASAMHNFFGAFNNLFGKPENSWGVTPLFIFRKTPSLPM